jgi:hypothetical protein
MIYLDTCSMPPKPVESAPPHLTFAQVLNRQGPHLAAFLEACEKNDTATALQLVSDRDEGLLTFGLN